MSNIEGKIVFKIINTKVICLQVTFFTKDNVKLTKQINESFKKPVYWNEYKIKIESRNLYNDNLTRICLDASFQRVKKMFVLPFDNTDGANKIEKNSHKKYFLARVDITKYNVLIDGRTFYDQPITDQVKIMMRLEKFKQDKEMIIQEDVCEIIYISKIIINKLLSILVNKKT